MNQLVMLKSQALTTGGKSLFPLSLGVKGKKVLPKLRKWDHRERAVATEGCARCQNFSAESWRKLKRNNFLSRLSPQVFCQFLPLRKLNWKLKGRALGTLALWVHLLAEEGQRWIWEGVIG